MSKLNTGLAKLLIKLHKASINAIIYKLGIAHWQVMETPVYVLISVGKMEHETSSKIIPMRKT